MKRHWVEREKGKRDGVAWGQGAGRRDGVAQEKGEWRKEKGRTRRCRVGERKVWEMRRLKMVAGDLKPTAYRLFL